MFWRQLGRLLLYAGAAWGWFTVFFLAAGYLRHCAQGTALC